MKKYILTLILITLGANVYLEAQVTIGSTKKAADYSILELDASEVKGGFLLPQLDAQKRSELKEHLLQLNDPSEANGLVIYDISDNKMKYWTGADWASIDQEHQLVGKNGITVIDELRGGVKLGGEMIDKQTVISITGSDKSLSFSVMDGDQDGKFLITFNKNTTNPSLIVKSNKVGIGTENPEMQLDIKSQNPTNKSEKPLRITGSKEKPNYLLASDSEGNASWEPFMPVSSVIPGKLYDGSIAGRDVFGFWARYDGTSGSQTPDLENMNLTQETIKVGRGKWLIVAKYSSYTKHYNSSSHQGSSSRPLICRYGCPEEYYHYIKLYAKKSEETGWQEQTVMASLPEQEPDTYLINPNGPNIASNREERHYTSPQLFYYYENNTDDEHELAIFGSTSRQAFLSERYGGPFFQALRIDGLLSSAIEISGTVSCSGLTGTREFNMKANDVIDQTLGGYLNFKLTSGSTVLTPGQIIGSKYGIRLEVVDGPYNLSTTTTQVKVKVIGQLDTDVFSGPFTIPVKVTNASFPHPDQNCNVVTINVQTDGTLAALNYDKNQYSGIGRSFSVEKRMSLHMKSGSTTLSPGDILGSVNGIVAEYAGSRPLTFISIGDYIEYIPIKFSGTVAASAPATFSIPVQLSNTTPTEISPAEGLIVHVIDGSLNCGSAVRVPSNIKVSTSGKINISLSSNSGPYKLDFNTNLGASSSGITVRYAGSTRNLTAGSSTAIDVTYTSNNILATGTYTVPLTNLNSSGVNIAECTATIIVEDYGMFDCNSMSEYATQGVSQEAVSIEAPLKLTVNNGSVELKAGDIIGEATYSGNKYTVAVIAPISLTGTSASPSTVDVMVRISGNAITSPGNFTIALNKIPGIRSCNLNMSFKVFGAFDCSTISPVNLTLPASPVNVNGIVKLNITDGKVSLKAGDVLGETTKDGMNFKVIVVNPVTLTSSGNVDVRITGPAVSTQTSFNIPLNKVRGVTTCSVNVNFNN